MILFSCQTRAKELEQELLNFINDIESNIKNIQNGLNRLVDVVILVGGTGSGKSTIFNILCGAQFELIRNEGIDRLQVKQGTKSYSQMKHGAESITLSPIYYYIQNENILLIDFPGFEDTRGELLKIFPQILLSKIATKNYVKLVYVFQQPLADLPTRGEFLQEFFKKFQNQNFKFSDTFLLINQFAVDQVSEQNLINYDRKQLYTLTKDIDSYNQNIFVIRLFLQSNIQQLPFIRQKLINELKKQNPIQFKPFRINHVEYISNYLLENSRILTQNVQNLLQQSLGRKYQIKELSLAFSNYLYFLQYQSVVNQYAKLFQLYKELGDVVGIYNYTLDIENFLKIYNFFEEFSESINGYTHCVENLQQITNQVEFFNGQLKILKRVYVMKKPIEGFGIGSHYFLLVKLENGEDYTFGLDSNGLNQKESLFRATQEYYFDPNGFWTLDQFTAQCQMRAKKNYSWCYGNCIDFVNNILDDLGSSYQVSNPVKYVFGYFLFPVCILPFGSLS